MSITAQAALGGSGGRELDNCIERIARGDREALATLYYLSSSSVYGFALSVCRNVQDAEDVLQEVYIQVWKNAGNYVPLGKPMAWLLTAARNLALMRLRERGRTLPLELEDWRVQLADTPAVSTDDRLLLEAMLSRLGDEERQIVMLHAVSGLKHREIAGLLSIPLPTVLSKYNRALKKLKTAMKEADSDA